MSPTHDVPLRGGRAILQYAAGVREPSRALEEASQAVRNGTSKRTLMKAVLDGKPLAESKELACPYLECNKYFVAMQQRTYGLNPQHIIE